MKQTAAQAENTRRRIVADELAAYEHAHQLVPGTASWHGTAAGGGQELEGLARMAAARRPQDRTRADLAALARYPAPRSSLTGRPLEVTEVAG